MSRYPGKATYEVLVNLEFNVRFQTDADTAEEARALGLAIMRDAWLRSPTLNPDDCDDGDEAPPRRCFSWNVEPAPENPNRVWVGRSDEWRPANEPEAHVYLLAQMAGRLRTLEENRAIVPERARPILDTLIASQRREIDALVDKLAPRTAPLPFDVPAGEVGR